MKYYIIVGEASGDIHASRLMQSLRNEDPQAEFRFFGGDNMTAVGGTRVRHYRDLAYMGFVPVLLHLRTILGNMAFCKRDIAQWQPSVVILVDYPGFNLSIARYVRAHTNIPVYYYISPKIWAWKEYRIRNIKRDVSEMFSILPFEVPFYEGKHHFPIHYVGNPTADEVRSFRAEYKESLGDFCDRHHTGSHRPIIALLPGSRFQEINDNLPAMIAAASRLSGDYQLLIAGAPSIETEYYKQVIANHKGVSAGDYPADIRIGNGIELIANDTFALLSHATAALVTSGTATLETALFNVPQVVCYRTPLPRLIRFAFNHIIKVRFISLVNLIDDSEIVQELLADRFTVANISHCLHDVLPGQQGRTAMLEGYKRVHAMLGDTVAPDNAARIMVRRLRENASATPFRT